MKSRRVWVINICMALIILLIRNNYDLSNEILNSNGQQKKKMFLENYIKLTYRFNWLNDFAPFRIFCYLISNLYFEILKLNFEDNYFITILTNNYVFNSIKLHKNCYRINTKRCQLLLMFYLDCVQFGNIRVEFSVDIALDRYDTNMMDFSLGAQLFIPLFTFKLVLTKE